MTPKAEQSGVAFDQRIAKFVVRGLSRTPLTPNQVTLFSIFLGLAVALPLTPVIHRTEHLRFDERENFFPPVVPLGPSTEHHPNEAGGSPQVVQLS